MEVKILPSGVYSVTAIPSLGIGKRSFFCKLTILASSSSNPFFQSQKWVSSGACNSISLRVCSGKGIEKRTSAKQTRILAADDDRIRSQVRRKNVAVFVSRRGSNFRSIHQASFGGSVHGDIVVLVTNKSDCGGAEYARTNGIPIVIFPKAKDESGQLSPSDLVDTIRKFKVDFIFLAGYLKLMPVELIRAYERSIINIHPSFLPAFGGKGYYGMKVHKAVIASGARYSGPTIHVVNEHYDIGCILAQHVVPVLANDVAEDLAARVLKEVVEFYIIERNDHNTSKSGSRPQVVCGGGRGFVRVAHSLEGRWCSSYSKQRKPQ